MGLKLKVDVLSLLTFCVQDQEEALIVSERTKLKLTEPEEACSGGGVWEWEKIL